MDDDKVLENEFDKEAEFKEPPKWKCEFVDRPQEVTVGDLLKLNCTGLESVPMDGVYKLDLKLTQHNNLRILKTLKDEPSEKTFEVTSYKAYKAPLFLKFKNAKGEIIFSSDVPESQVVSVLKQGDKVNPPVYFPYAFKWAQMILPAVILLAVLALILMKFMSRMAKERKFQEVVSESKYEDIFLEFNIDLVNLGKANVEDLEFTEKLERVCKKLFYRYFGEALSFDNYAKLEKKMLAMGIEAFEVRKFSVFTTDLKLLKANGDETKNLNQADVVRSAKSLGGILQKYHSKVLKGGFVR